MARQISLSTPIERLPGVGSATAERLQRLGVETVQQLLELLPFRFEDRSNLFAIRDLPPNKEVVIAGQIVRISSRVSKRGTLVIQAVIEDQSGKITALWFNQRYLLKVLKEGDPIMLFGTKRPSPTLNNPFIVKKIITQPEIAPIYPSTAGLNQPTIFRLLQRIRPLISEIKDIVPAEYLAKLHLPSRRIALDAAHFSPSEKTLSEARQLLGFEELLLLSIQALQAKQNRYQQIAPRVRVKQQQLAGLKNLLPFTLTPGQEQALKEIYSDLQLGHPMNRLLYGEVGSGKTAIGLITAALLATTGKTVVWLSPTTTLANQQIELTRQYFKKLGVKVAQITGSVKEKNPEAKVFVGTHALLQKHTLPDDVGLVVIDEQQRFGVEQRRFILGHHPNSHLLMMTATPIPRSLAQTILGHLDITFLSDKPTHQKPVKTYVFTDSQRHKIEEHIAKRLVVHQPGYVICPLIDQTSVVNPTLFHSERRSITVEADYLRQTFPKAKIGLIHGRLKAVEKEQLMNDFYDGKIDILLSTSVVEVGIDNPKATWIIVEEADYFGLSQLHQLRGRVGRGDRPSVCFLHYAESSPLALQRLQVLSRTDRGLTIAEEDLRLRGPGEIAGLEQSGLPPLRYATLQSVEEIARAYATAQELVKSGLERYPSLQMALKRYRTHEATTA